jgi:hypothetical protein
VWFKDIYWYLDFIVINIMVQAFILIIFILYVLGYIIKPSLQNIIVLPIEIILKIFLSINLFII